MYKSVQKVQTHKNVQVLRACSMKEFWKKKHKDNDDRLVNTVAAEHEESSRCHHQQTQQWTKTRHNYKWTSQQWNKKISNKQFNSLPPLSEGVSDKQTKIVMATTSDQHEANELRVDYCTYFYVLFFHVFPLLHCAGLLVQIQFRFLLINYLETSTHSRPKMCANDFLTTCHYRRTYIL